MQYNPDLHSVVESQRTPASFGGAVLSFFASVSLVAATTRSAGITLFPNRTLMAWPMPMPAPACASDRLDGGAKLTIMAMIRTTNPRKKACFIGIDLVFVVMK